MCVDRMFFKSSLRNVVGRKKPCINSSIGSRVRACVTDARATVYVCVAWLRLDAHASYPSVSRENLKPRQPANTTATHLGWVFAEWEEREE